MHLSLELGNHKLVTSMNSIWSTFEKC